MNRRRRSIFKNTKQRRVRRGPNPNNVEVIRLRPQTLRTTAQVAERLFAQQHAALVGILAGLEPCRVHDPSSSAHVALATQSQRRINDGLKASAKMVLSIPSFRGTETPLEAEMWIGEFEKMQHRHNWYEGVAMECVRFRLAGRAADWFTTNRMELMTFSRFCCYFKFRFVEGYTSMQIKWSVMTERVQRPEEPAYDYAFEKLALCDLIGLNFQYTKKQLLLGLRSKRLARATQKRRHQTAEDLLRDLVKYEKAAQRRSDRACQRYLAAIGKA